MSCCIAGLRGRRISPPSAFVGPDTHPADPCRCLDDDEFAASDVYCPSVRGIYAYFNSSMSAEELFPQSEFWHEPYKCATLSMLLQ